MIEQNIVAEQLIAVVPVDVALLEQTFRLILNAEEGFDDHVVDLCP